MQKIQLIIKSIGRPTLEMAVESAYREGFEPLIVYDGPVPANGVYHSDFSYPTMYSLPKKWGSYGFMAANVGIAMSDAEYIMFLDDDDELIEGAGDIVREYLNNNDPDILIPGIRFNQNVSINFTGTPVVGTDFCIFGDVGVRPGNVAMAIYKQDIFRKVPFREYENPNYSDFQHIVECLGRGYMVEYLEKVLYLVRPKSEGPNGRGQ